jgi:hypothetical protein
MSDNEIQKTTLIDRVLRKELLLVLVGLIFLGSGVYREETMQCFWGVMVILGAVALYFVKKKDWKKHWEEQEQLKILHDQARARDREKRDEKKK